MTIVAPQWRYEFHTLDAPEMLEWLNAMYAQRGLPLISLDEAKLAMEQTGSITQMRRYVA